MRQQAALTPPVASNPESACLALETRTTRRSAFRTRPEASSLEVMRISDGNSPAKSESYVVHDFNEFVEIQVEDDEMMKTTGHGWFMLSTKHFAL